MARLTVLIDNEPGTAHCLTEHGLSCLLECDNGSQVLWDTGQSEKFLRNARLLGLDAAKADVLALSHGHYDHTGGLPALLQAGFSGPIFAHPDALAQRYAITDTARPRAIGLPVVLPPESVPRCRPVTEPTELAPGLRMFCPITRLPGMRESVRNFFWDSTGARPDSVPDDAALLLETKGKTVVVLGCCHAGLGNTLYEIRRRAGVEKIDVILGGLHLMDAPLEKAAHWVAQVAAILREFQVQTVYAGHCTGAGARDLLRKQMERDGARVYPLGAGTSLEL